MSKSALILVDGSSFLYRAYYAAKHGFTTSRGYPTGATLIITRMLKNLILRYPVNDFVVVFDAPGKSFRHEMYADYKANRRATPEDLKLQFVSVERIVKALGLPFVQVDGVEADDVLGSYARAAEASGRDVIICTGDKDLAQLVSPRIRLYDSMNNSTLDITGVKDKYGVAPEHITDLLALKGDSSDNIPGMSKVGDVTACAVINALGGIDDIMRRKDEVVALGFRGSKTFASRFCAEFEQIKMSYDLARIRTDVPLPVALDSLQPPVAQHEQLLAIYAELEFSAFYKEELEKGAHKGVAAGAGAAGSAGSASGQAGQSAAAQTDSSASAAKTDVPAVLTASGALRPLEHWKGRGSTCTIVRTSEDLQALVRALQGAELFAFDTETDSLQAQTCHLVGLSFALQEKHAWYVPIGHTGLEAQSQLPLSEVVTALQPVLADGSIKKVGHNVKFDLLVLHFAAGLSVKGVYADSMIMGHLLDSLQKLSLDDMAARYLHYRTITYSEVTHGRKDGTFADCDITEAAAYSGEDAEVSLRLYQVLLQELQRIPSLEKLLFAQEMPFLQVLFAMECCGAYVSAAELEKQNQNLRKELAQLQQDIFVAAGQRFNIASPKQLGRVLFQELAIPYLGKPKLGKGGVYTFSTAEDVLTQIAPHYDIANLVLRYRALAKLISTYTEKLPLLIQKNGRIYTSFNQAGTVTGRLSSSDPNLQNIPARTQEGRQIRRAFIAPAGYKILSADYSQIELRLIADIADEPVLIRAFKEGRDIHRFTAAEVLGKELSEVTPAERSHAKATNFGLMYGMGPHGLSVQTGMPYKDAREYVERYFARYPKVRDYMERIKQEAHEHEYVTTIMGHRIYFASINSQDKRQQASAERAAINAPMQGSAADIIKNAMLAVQAWIDTLPPETVRMTLQVHDELVFEVKEDFVPEASAKIKELMEHVVQLKVPLVVGTGVADNWADAH